MTVVGIDIGGTKIAGALVDGSGTVLDKCTAATPTSGPVEVLAVVGEIAEAVRGERRPAAIGVGTGGVVDSAEGRIVSATDLLTDWSGTEVATELSRRLGVGVYVDNDANALAAGELYFGRISATGLFIAVGTGIGGSLVVDGALRHGQHHTAGGIGHMMSPIPTSRICSCGRRSHLEALASGPALAAEYQHRCGNDENVIVQTIAERAANGERLATEVIETRAHALGQGIGGAANLVDPDVIVVGGGVANMGEPFWKPLRRGVRAELLPPLRDISIEPPQLQDDASVIGAAAVAFMHLD